MSAERGWSLRSAAAMMLVVVLSASGCTDSSTGTSGSTNPFGVTQSAMPTTPKSPDSADLAKTEVLAAYDAFWLAQVASEANPKRQQNPNLANYSIDKALSDTEATILLFRHSGIEMRGQPTHSVNVTSVVLTDPPTATITDCLDSTYWRPVYVATGKSALAPGQSPRVLVDSTATIYNGRWVIRTSVAHRDQPC